MVAVQQNAFSLARETRREPFVGCARGDVTVTVRAAAVGVLFLCAFAVRWRVTREHSLTRAAVAARRSFRDFAHFSAPARAVGRHRGAGT